MLALYVRVLLRSEIKECENPKYFAGVFDRIKIMHVGVFHLFIKKHLS